MYVLKILLFTLSTGVSHTMAYNVLESLRLRLADRFLHAPLGSVAERSIGEIKTMMVDKIENIEPPLAHMIPEGAAPSCCPSSASWPFCAWTGGWPWHPCVTFPLSFLCMGLTFRISGKNFEIV